MTILRTIINWIRNLKNGYNEKKSVKIYLGKILPVEAISFKPGQRILTSEGIGTIVGQNITLNNETEYIISLKKGNSFKRSKADELMQFAVYNDDKKLFIRLSFSDYEYIVENNQAIIYRITNRNFAKMVSTDREHYEYAKIIHRTRNGLRIYREFKRKGYELRKCR